MIVKLKGELMDKPLTVNLPYPSISQITEDRRSAEIIAPAYAGRHGELNAILQYVYHHYFFADDGIDETADILIAISVAEMKHLEILGETLLKLGTDPVYTVRPPYKCDFYSGGFVSYSKTARKMLLDDISGEMLAVREYEAMLNVLTNEDVAAVIARIKLDEELHIKVLREQLERFC